MNGEDRFFAHVGKNKYAHALLKGVVHQPHKRSKKKDLSPPAAVQAQAPAAAQPAEAPTVQPGTSLFSLQGPPAAAVAGPPAAGPTVTTGGAPTAAQLPAAPAAHSLDSLLQGVSLAHGIPLPLLAAAAQAARTTANGVADGGGRGTAAAAQPAPAQPVQPGEEGNGTQAAAKTPLICVPFAGKKN